MGRLTLELLCCKMTSEPKNTASCAERANAPHNSNPALTWAVDGLLCIVSSRESFVLRWAAPLILHQVGAAMFFGFGKDVSA